MSAEQDFSISPGSSLTWGSADPRPVAVPESMDIGYGWRPYGSVSGSAEPASTFDPGSTTSANWMATTPGTPQLDNWSWDSGMPPTVPARSVSFSGELMSQQQMVPVPSNAPYSGGGGPNMGNTFASPMNQNPGLGHLPSQVGDPRGNWQPQQQHMLQQQQAQQLQMGFEAWGISHSSDPPM